MLGAVVPIKVVNCEIEGLRGAGIHAIKIGAAIVHGGHRHGAGSGLVACSEDHGPSLERAGCAVNRALLSLLAWKLTV